MTVHSKPVEEDIILDIRRPMAVLNVTMPTPPEILMAGQVLETYIEAKNIGGRDMCNLKVLMSHPEIFYFGHELVKRDETHHVPSNVQIQNSLESSGLLSFDLEATDGILKAGDSVRIPVIIRGENIGMQNCKFIFGYSTLVF